MSSPVLRFDTAALYEALDSARQRRRWSWTQLARELHVATATLTRAADGGRMAGDNAATFVDWLELSHEAFLRGPDSSAPPDLWTQMRHVIQAEPELPGELAQMLARILGDLIGVDPAQDREIAGQPRPARKPSAPIVAAHSPDAFTRIDSMTLRRALDEERAARGLTWREVAREIGQPDVVSASSLADIGNPGAPHDSARASLGARIGVLPFMAVVQWLGLPSESFLSRPPGRSGPGLPARLRSLVRLRRDLSALEAERIERGIVEECRRLGLPGR